MSIADTASMLCFPSFIFQSRLHDRFCMLSFRISFPIFRSLKRFESTINLFLLLLLLSFFFFLNGIILASIHSKRIKKIHCRTFHPIKSHTYYVITSSHSTQCVHLSPPEFSHASTRKRVIPPSHTHTLTNLLIKKYRTNHDPRNTMCDYYK